MKLSKVFAGEVIPREGVERLCFPPLGGELLTRVIPREGVESPFLGAEQRVDDLVLVIPREGVESVTERAHRNGV